MVAMSDRSDRRLDQHPHEEEKQREDRDLQQGVYPAPKADAALVSRGALKSGYLWKLGANVPKWKRRFFVLKPITMLFYYMSEHDTEPRGCIDLDLFDAVRRVGGEEDDDRGTGASSVGFSAAATSNVGSSSSNGSKRKRASSARTTFELYRSGSPDGSGFMLEARGGEDWEQWVESIANGRHGKMLSEMEVMKGANKLLLDEINGLERQVATFRGYADQRHVTVLALRDERERSREVAAELATLGDTASALSHLISDSLKGDRRRGQGQGAAAAGAGAGAGGMAAFGEAGGVAGEHGFDAAAEARGEGTSSSTLPSEATTAAVAAEAAERPRPSEAAAAGAARDGGGGDNDDDDDKQVNKNDHKELSQQVAEERASLAAVRTALAEARAEILRRGRALQEETERRRAVEGTVQRAQGLAREAEERAEAAEETTARWSGRVSVLERNVQYLQTQQHTLRAELCQAQRKTQLIRAQKAVLKKEVRDMWTRQASSTLIGGRATHAGAGSAKADHYRRQAAGGGGARGGQQAGGSRRRTRTWASMGDLAEADVCLASGGGPGDDGPGERRERATAAAAATATCEAEGEDEHLRGSGCSRQRGESMQSRPSRDSLAAASDGGDTDFADRTSSEASYAGDENIRFPSDCSLGASGPSRNSLFREGVCLTIRRRVGPPQVPSLPPSRHRRTLMAVKNHSLLDNDGNINAAVATTAQQRQQQQQHPERFYSGEDEIDDVGGGGGITGGFAALGAGGNSGGPPAATAGLGVAGMFLGLRKGMVDKAAQEMGKKLSLWPGSAMGGMPSVSSLGSLAAGALSGATGNGIITSNGGNNLVDSRSSGNSGSIGCDLGAGYHPQTPVGSPRSASASLSALTDSPVRWDPSSQHGSIASSDLGLEAPPATTMPAVGGRGGEMDDTANPAARHGESLPIPASAILIAGAKPAGVAATAAGGGGGGGGIPRIASTSSRTPLIQLADLELAEPCSRRIDSGSGRQGSKRLLSLLPPRPDDEYELLFTTKVIGLQFAQLPDGAGVCVSGTNGYVGPAQTGAGRIPGEKVCPDIDDVLESYNGISARGKSAKVVCGELARCGRPLRLGFRSTRAEFVTDEADQEGGRVVWMAAQDRRPPPQQQQQQRRRRWAEGSGGVASFSGSRDGEAHEGAGMSTCRDSVTFGSASPPRTVS